jgi:uncharacterized protein (TIGR02118 family)
MASLIVMYKTPIDPKAFDKYYFETHVPLAKKIPGLKSYSVSEGPVMTPEGPSALHLIATLEFENIAAIQQAFGSPEGQVAAGDLQNFASGGADLIMFDDRKI